MDSIQDNMTTAIANGPNDLTHIVKGKRTKRQRPQSPIPFTVATPGSRPDNVSNNNSVDTTTDEDEDTAKCLILLSQGPSPDSPSMPNIMINSYNHNDEEFGTTYKYTSKRYIETSTTCNGKAGIYVYECKTCNRTFPSFQALGGHRASHKKPKLVGSELERKRPVSDDEEPQFKFNNAGLSLQLGNRPAPCINRSGSKVHECAICGAEFTSGQALGGHMRRHRGTTLAIVGSSGGVGVGVGGGGGNTTLSLSPTSTPIGANHHSSLEKFNDKNPNKETNGFFLDLNLPPTPEPEEQGVVDHNNNGDLTVLTTEKFSQLQNNPALVLSAAPALVDCHY